MTTTGPSPGGGGEHPAPPPQSLRHLASVIAALVEAAQAATNGEVVVKSAAGTARIFIADGRIAWAVTSNTRRTFGRHLVQQGFVTGGDLTAVLAECKASGRNFAETIVAWGLMSEATLRAELLLEVARAVGEVLPWQGAVAMFVPSGRVYQGKLTFDAREVLEAIDRLGGPGPTLAAALLEGLPPAPSGSAFTDLLARIRSAATPAAPPAPPPAAADRVVNAEEVLSRLREVDGYQASALFARGGELLGGDASDQVLAPAHLAVGGAELLSAAKAGLETTWGAPTEVVLLAEERALVLRSREVPGFGELGVILALDRADRVNLARLQLDRILPELVVETS